MNFGVHFQTIAHQVVNISGFMSHKIFVTYNSSTATLKYENSHRQYIDMAGSVVGFQ